MNCRTLLERLSVTLLDAENRELPEEAAKERLGREVTGITNDSRKIVPGGLFFCIVGMKSNGHAFAASAVLSGARFLVVSEPVDLSGVPEEIRGEVTLICTDNTRKAMALLSAAFYGYPAEKLRIIGVTGTKGKTTTTYLIRSILESAGIKTGLIGTIETIIGEKHMPDANTTPESIVLQKTFAEMVEAGIDAVVMEVSSQALMLDRTAGIPFEIGIFTNISPDHIGPGEHKDFADYMACKGRLFRQCRIAVVNGDDPHTKDVLAGNTCERIETFGMEPSDDLRAEDLALIEKPGELGISFRTEGTVTLRAEVPTPGTFSVYNALAAIAAAAHFGVTTEEITEALKTARVRGRIEMVPVPGNFTLLIDYAHNAVALESLLTTLRAYHPHRLVCLFGCGGNRSKLRRFEMGETAGRIADFTIITSDNPRDEDPMAIIKDIVDGGMAKTDGEYITIPDRREAIRYAIDHGGPGDIVVLAGKGHEDYQEIRGKRYPMDERVIIREILKEEGRA